MSSSDLVRITITRRSDGLYDVVRERCDSGERATGLRTLEEALDYVRDCEKDEEAGEK